MLLMKPIKLTEYQHDVLYWYSAGKTHEEIAIILSRSKRSVRTTLEALKHKFGVSHWRNLLHLALEKGFLVQERGGQTIHVHKAVPKEPQYPGTKYREPTLEELLTVTDEDLERFRKMLEAGPFRIIHK